MGRYNIDKPPSPREARIFLSLFKPPYEARQILKSHLRKLPKVIQIIFQFYLILVLIALLMALFVLGLAYAPLLIVIAGIIVYLTRRQKKSKLK
jgi:ABC-type bacteriocin/lantibiotic exporter with double-glycine peptidase domain